MSLIGQFVPTGMLPQIAVVGSINMDLVAQVERLPRPGETVSSKGLVQLSGGKGANQAVAAAKLGAETMMLGRLGEDAFANSLRESLSLNHVNVENVLPTPCCSSGVAMIGVEEGGQNSITIVSGANGEVSYNDVIGWDDLLTQVDAVLVQLEIPLETVEAVLSRCHECGILSVLDPAPMPMKQLGSKMYLAEVLTPNQTEAEQLVGFPVNDYEAAVRATEELQRRGASTVIIKMGEQGAVYADETGNTGHVAAPQVEVVDTTAAGDAFNAAFAIACVEGKPLSEAVRFACATGSLATTQLGAQQAMPTRSEVDRLYKLSRQS